LPRTSAAAKNGEINKRKKERKEKEKEKREKKRAISILY
jgi:hypothetical protein